MLKHFNAYHQEKIAKNIEPIYKDFLNETPQNKSRLMSPNKSSMISSVSNTTRSIGLKKRTDKLLREHFTDNFSDNDLEINDNILISGLCCRF